VKLRENARWLMQLLHEIAAGGEEVAEKIANLICIFGKAGEGKSTLMNVLAQLDGVFAISNKSVPCTSGCDMSSHTSSLEEYAGHSGSGNGDSDSMRIAYVDVEGQGDQDEAYDMQVRTRLFPDLFWESFVRWT